MHFDFDQIIERKNTGCVKWDESPAVSPALGGKTAEDIIPLWVADMDFAVAPAIQEAICRRAQHPIFGYTHVGDDYYDAVISWFDRRHHWHIEREHILYTTGVVPAMSCAIKALTMPGERVLILSPDYNCFFSSIRNNGCEVLESMLRLSRNKRETHNEQEPHPGPNEQEPHPGPNEQEPHPGPNTQGRFGLDWAAFEAHCADDKTTVFLLCNPHNPTGRVWTREELQRMADICHRHHVRIVSDEIHCELIMPGHTFCPMATVDADAVILNSPSKSFNTAGLQIANIICRDAETRRRIDRAVNINEVCDVNPFAPEALKAAYNDSEAWLDALNGYLWDNYQTLCAFCATHLPYWRVMPLEGTYLIWVDVSLCCNSVAAYTDSILRSTGVWLNPGTMYGPVSGEGYVRINIACPRSRLLDALRRISKYSKSSTTSIHEKE